MRYAGCFELFFPFRKKCLQQVVLTSNQLLAPTRASCLLFPGAIQALHVIIFLLCL